MPTRLIIVKNAEVESDSDVIFESHSGSLLSSNGQMQADKLAQALKTQNVEVLYSSTEHRAISTAKHISVIIQSPIIASDEIKEIYFGLLENTTWSEIKKSWPEVYDVWFSTPHLLKFPEGESMNSFKNRVISKVRSIVNQNVGKTICIVTHQFVINLLINYFKGVDCEQLSLNKNYKNSSITVVDVERGNFEILLENDVSHLEN